MEIEIGTFEKFCTSLEVDAAFRPVQGEDALPSGSCARLIEPVATAVRELATVDGSQLIDITNRRPGLPSLTLVSEGSYEKYLVLNRFKTHEASVLSPLGEVWGPSGSFGLQAVVLEAGRDRKGRVGRLWLVLPTWRKTVDEREETARALGVIGIDTRGRTYVRIAWGTVYGPEGMAGIDRAMTVECFFGLQCVEGFYGYASNYFSITECLGFPGAEQTLMGSLGDLAEYFRRVASAL